MSKEREALRDLKNDVELDEKRKDQIRRTVVQRDSWIVLFK
jgi:hypothetical protein